MKDEILAGIQQNMRIESVRGEAQPDAPYGPGPKAALEDALELGRKLGFKVGQADNRIGWVEYGEGKEMVGVLGHVDVVPAGDTGWTYPAYGAEIHDGILWGRGCLDDKGPIIGSIYALKAIRDLNLPIDRRIRVIFGSDEECGSSCAAYYVENGYEMPTIGFTPDEEVGRGADHFDVEKFDADFAYTMDGDTEGEIQYENFNAADAIFEIKGVNVHPGSAKDVMVNAALVAMEINAALPEGETPADTEDYEGFYHLVSMSGDVACAKLHYIVRDHDTDKFAARLETLKEISKQMNLKWGLGTVKLTIDEQYRNMAEIIKDGNMHLIENAKKACLAADVTPLILPIRGGTDGARLSFMGLPCPNLGTGGHGYHGPFVVTITAAAAAAVALAPVVCTTAVGCNNSTVGSRNNGSSHDACAGNINSAVVINFSVLKPFR